MLETVDRNTADRTVASGLKPHHGRLVLSLGEICTLAAVMPCFAGLELILGFLIAVCLLGPTTVILGVRDLWLMSEGRMEESGRPAVLWGILLALIGMVLACSLTSFVIAMSHP